MALPHKLVSSRLTFSHTLLHVPKRLSSSGYTTVHSLKHADTVAIYCPDTCPCDGEEEPGHEEGHLELCPSGKLHRHGQYVL